MSNVTELNSVVDEIFRTLEEVRHMFRRWDASYHMEFIGKVMHLNMLREKLHTLGYTDDFVEAVIKIAYEHVFTPTERTAYAGNWYIVK